MENYYQTLGKIFALRGNFNEILQDVAQIISSECSIDRVSLWRGNSADRELSCLTFFNLQTQQFEMVPHLSAIKYPSYFSIIEKQFLLDVEDAIEDSRLFEFRNDYLLSSKVMSLLDAPIMINGKMEGMVRFEQTKTKCQWSNELKNLAITIALFIGQKFIQDSNHIELSAEKDKLKSLINGFPHLFFIKDREGHYLEVNEALAKYFSLPQNEIIGKTAYDLYPADEAIQHHYVDLKVLRSGKTEVYESKRLKKGQGIQTVVITKAPLHDAFGTIIGTVAMGLDVTDQNIADEQHRRLQNQLIQSSKLTSLGMLATGIAHEINNSLTVSFGFLGVLEEVLSEKEIYDGDLKSSILSIHKSLERIKIITQELRTYARSDTDKIDCVDFEETVNSAILLCRSLFDKDNVHIQVQYNCPRPLFLGNRSAIQQVIMNILTNARDAILLTGKKDGKIIIQTRQEAENLVVDVIDNGCGIQNEVIGKIFHPFFTTKNSNSGIGLGLSIAQNIVQAADGEIQAFNGTPEGAIFRIILPLADVAEKLERNHMHKVESEKNNLQVLIVDDEIGLVNLLKTYLASWKFQIDYSVNGNDALAKIATGKKYDLIIADYRIPGMNGVKVLSEIRQRGFSGKCLLLTGFLGDLSPKNVEEMTYYVDDVLRKPFDQEALASTLVKLGFKIGV